MQTDLLKRLENTLGDCVIGPIRTLKTGDLADVLYDAHEEIERLRAENERLREALTQIEKWTAEMTNNKTSYVGTMIRNKARAALAEQEKK